MCKLVGYVGSTPQYEFCDDYKKAIAQLNLWSKRLGRAKDRERDARREVDKIIREHQSQI